MKRILNIVVLALILSICISGCAKLSGSTNVEKQPWWQNAVFYEIFVRSFYDSDGDGVGDFNGITDKLDYLTNLGIDAIWLMPINPSPSYHGYDVINYFNVNPDYGNMEDFKHLLDEAHARGMHVIIDLVINHTSNQNPWFVDANNNPSSPYRDWYIWSANDPGYSGPLGNAWHSGNQGYYYGIFSDRMPDLNYTNPEVGAEMLKIVNFWLTSVGVDGFRVDAVKYLIEEGQKQENTTSTHEWLKGFYSAYKADNPEAFAVGEVYGAGAFAATTYLGQLDEIFSFELAGGFVNSAQGESNTAMVSAMKFTLKDMPNGLLATFLTNHDQNRVMSVLGGNMDKAKVAAGLMLTSPGTPFIYYGEEVGMEGIKPDEDIRRPMQWDGTIHAGFTSGNPWREAGENYVTANVADESSDPDSLLSFYQNFIELRKQHPALQDGSWVLVDSNDTGVFAALRIDQQEAILVVANLTRSPITDYSLNFQSADLKDRTYKLAALSGPDTSSAIKIASSSSGEFAPVSELPPYGLFVYQLKP
jgi:alpha-amylase